MGMLLMLSWMVYVVCFAVTMVDPLIGLRVREYVRRTGRTWIEPVVLVISIGSMVVMVCEYGFWTMVIWHVAIGCVSYVRRMYAK